MSLFGVRGIYKNRDLGKTAMEKSESDHNFTLHCPMYKYFTNHAWYIKIALFTFYFTVDV